MTQKKIKVKYNPVELEVIDLQTAATEFANLLQIAGRIAVANQDFKKIIKVTDSWFELIKIIGPSEEEESEEIKSYGFEGFFDRKEDEDGLSTDED